MNRTPTERLRVAKKLLPGQPGTLKLGRRFGDALLCVRYRLDAQARRRYTTVELIVDHGPMAPRPDRLVGVRIRFEEAELRNQVKQHGAVWDRNAGVWRMPYRTASGLGLKARIVET
jgi:hypothetical protein